MKPKAGPAYDFRDETLYWEGPPHRGDLAINIALGTTLLWLPLTFAALGRGIFVNYRFTDRRLSVSTSAPWKSTHPRRLAHVQPLNDACSCSDGHVTSRQYGPLQTSCLLTRSVYMPKKPIPFFSQWQSPVILQRVHVWFLFSLRVVGVQYNLAQYTPAFNPRADVYAHICAAKALLLLLMADV